MNCRHGSVRRGHCGSRLIFSREGKLEDKDSCRYGTKLGTITLCFLNKINKRKTLVTVDCHQAKVGKFAADSRLLLANFR